MPGQEAIWEEASWFTFHASLRWIPQNGAMIIQSSSQPVQRREVTAQTEEVDDDPWSGYQDTLEIEAVSDECALSHIGDNDFAAAEARLHQRGQVLHQQQLIDQQRRANQQPRSFPHLEGPTARNYGSSYYQSPPAIHTAPLTQSAVAQATSPTNPTQGNELPQADPLPYEIDAWGNPILPENAELDLYGNLVYRYV